MLEVWIDSEIQIYNNNNNQTKYYRSWRMWLGHATVLHTCEPGFN